MKFSSVLLIGFVLVLAWFPRASIVSGQEILWTQQFGTSNTDIAASVSVDSAAVYVAGRTDGTLPGQISSGGEDAFLRNYDLNGIEIWTRQFGSPQSDGVSGVSVDSGAVYVVGATTGTMTTRSSSGGSDVFVRKYDVSGNEIWTRQFGSHFADVGLSVSAHAGSVYVAGWTGGNLPGQKSSAGNLDAFVRKYDDRGHVVWTQQFGTSSTDIAASVSADASGVYVAGHTFGPLAGAQPSPGTADAFLRKYDSKGRVVWTQQFGTSSGDGAKSVSVDSGAVYVAGLTGGTLPGQTSLGGVDAFVRKYDLSGNEIWTRQFGSSSSDEAASVSVDSSGVYVAGHTFGTLSGFADAFVTKLTP